jgi:cupin 2 domain-containing protein
MKAINIFHSIPENLNAEVFEDILKLPGLRIERIISNGQSTPDDAWYDQDEAEWVILLEGGAILEFENDECVTLKKGDYLNIAAHRKHKVKWTDPNQISIWLAIFYKE